MLAVSDSGEGEARADDAGVDAAERERALVFRLRRREAAAFEVLVREHQDRVFDFCARMLADREEAFDVTQDVFLSVHKSTERFRADARLSTWIIRIARNHCLNRIKYLKRRGRGRSEEYGEVDEGRLAASVEGSLAPDEAVAAARLRERLRRAIAELDTEQRELVILRDVEGLSYDEIVSITDLPEGTVKSRLHRARERLAAALERLERVPVLRGE